MLTTIRNAFSFIAEDAKTRPIFLAIETMSTLLGMAGALALAILNKDANFYFVWSAYGLSSMGLVYVAYVRKSTNIMILMTVYTMINIIGFVNTIIGA